MYVRKKYVRRGEKTYGPYWTVVESIRVNGEPRQRVVANIGLADNYYEADRIARLKEILCCIPGCGEAAAVAFGEGETTPFWYTVRLPNARVRKVPYIACYEHAQAYMRGEIDRIKDGFPALLMDAGGQRGRRR